MTSLHVCNEFPAITLIRKIAGRTLLYRVRSEDLRHVLIEEINTVGETKEM
jgi:hypothetical protein